MPTEETNVEVPATEEVAPVATEEAPAVTDEDLGEPLVEPTPEIEPTVE